VLFKDPGDEFSKPNFKPVAWIAIRKMYFAIWNVCSFLAIIFVCFRTDQFHLIEIYKTHESTLSQHTTIEIKKYIFYLCICKSLAIDIFYVHVICDRNQRVSSYNRYVHNSNFFQYLLLRDSNPPSRSRIL
jgi:hypothetical protein